MKFWTKMMIPVMVLGMVGFADAKGKKGAKEPAIKGTIVSVAADGSIKVREGKKGGTEMTISTTASTKVTIDGAKGKAVTDLQPGEKVTVKASAGSAKSINAKSAKAKKHNKKKK